MKKLETNAPSRLRGKTMAVFARHRPQSAPVVLSDCILEERGGRLFLVGASLAAEQSAQDWTSGARRAIAWDAIEEYLLFDTPDDYYARVLGAAAQAAQAAPANANGMIFEAPESSEGIPVEPSGIHVDLDTELEIGSSVLSFSQGRWWRAEVVGLEGDDQVTIHFPGWDSKWDVTLPKTELQVDLHDSLEAD